MKGFVIVENLLIIAPAGTLSVSFQRFRSSRMLGDVPNQLENRQNRWNFTDKLSFLGAYQ